MKLLDNCGCSEYCPLVLSNYSKQMMLSTAVVMNGRKIDKGKQRSFGTLSIPSHKVYGQINFNLIISTAISCLIT